MKKIAYSIIALALPVFAFSQSNGNPADTSSQKHSAVQAAANNTVLGPGSNSGRPIPVTAQLQPGQQPVINTSNGQAPPESASQLRLQQQNAGQQPAQQQGSPH